MGSILKSLLEKGYFPRELPPLFSTSGISEYESEIENYCSFERDSPTNVCLDYSIPKKINSRRNLGLTHIDNFSLLAFHIEQNWNEIEEIYNLSNISCTRPIQFIGTEGRAFKQVTTFKEFLRLGILCSYDKMIEVKVDITKFYSSIYTHSISWAIHGKEWSKSYRCPNQGFGNMLDYQVARGQDGQTNGIPIGSDTSFIIAETLLSKIDNEIESTLGRPLCGVRYSDDYKLYASSMAEAEEIKNTIEIVLSQYGLGVNEEKSKIITAPYAFTEDWVIAINQYNLLDNPESIEKFFSMVFSYASKYPDSAVIKYALNVISNLNFSPDHWNLLEALVIKSTVIDFSAIFQLAMIFEKNCLSGVCKYDSQKLKNFIYEILKRAIPLKHNFEITWALYLAKSFQLKVDEAQIKVILENLIDPFSAILATDLIHSGLSDTDFEQIKCLYLAKDHSFYKENWLYFYEAMIHGWLVIEDIHYNNGVLRILADNNFSFYRLEQEFIPDWLLGDDLTSGSYDI